MEKLRPSLIVANVGWLCLLGALIARDFRTPISTYSNLRYALILGAALGMVVFNLLLQPLPFIPSPFTGRGKIVTRPNLVVLLFALGLMLIVPAPYVLHHSFGSGDLFPYSVAAWTVCLMAAGLLALERRPRLEVMAKFGAVLFGIFFALVLMEVYVRLTYFDEEYLLIQPDMKLQFTPLEGVMPGVEGVSYFTTDNHGIRTLTPYDEFSADTYKILTIGGSTTEVLYLDDKESWAYLIQALGQAEGRDLWVGNVGRAGDKAIDHYFALRYFVPQVKIDMVIMMVGINDVALVLRNPESQSHMDGMSISYVLDHPHEKAVEFDSFFKAPYREISEKTGIASYDFFVREIQPMLWKQDDILVEDAVGQVYSLRRELWQKSPPTLDHLPDIFDSALETYRQNLNLIIDEADRQGIKLVLVNQPAVWSEDMPPEFEQYLWLIQYGNRLDSIARYTLPAMIEAMDRYNAVLAEVCAARTDVTCVDAASQMNGDTSLYYDDVHFNEAGSRRVAELIWDIVKEIIPD